MATTTTPAAAAPATAAAAKDKSSYARSLRTVLQLPLIVFSLTFAAYLGLRDDEWTWFDYHPAAMIVAWIGLMGNGVLTKKVEGYENTKLHGYIMFAGSTLAAFGFYVIYSNKDLMGYPHFMTTHGQFGGAIATTALVASFGSYIALNPDNGLLNKNPLVRAGHKWFTRFLILCAWYTCYEGLLKVHVDPMYSYSFAGVLICAAPFMFFL